MLLHSYKTECTIDGNRSFRYTQQMESTDAVTCLSHNRVSQLAALPSRPRTTPKGPANGLVLPVLAPGPELVRRKGRLLDTPRGTGDGSGMGAFNITGDPLTGVLGRRLLRGRGLSVGKLATEADLVLGVMRRSLLSLKLSPGLLDLGQLSCSSDRSTHVELQRNPFKFTRLESHGRHDPVGEGIQGRVVVTAAGPDLNAVHLGAC